MPKIVDHEQRKQLIAKAAAKTVSMRGLEATKLTDIAKMAGVTTGAITHYFKDKDAVLLAALDMAYGTLFTKIEIIAAETGTSFYDAMAQGMPLDTESAEYMAVWIAFWSRSAANPEISSQQIQFHHRWIETVKAELLRYDQQYEQLHADELDDLAEEITAQINGLIIRGIVDREAWPEARLRRMLKNYLARLGLYCQEKHT